MKRYLLTRSTDEEDIGDVDGIQCGFNDSLMTDTFVNLSIYEPYRHHTINVFRLDPKAIITDVLSIGTQPFKGILVSQKMYEIIKQFPVNQMNAIEATVHYRGKYLDYVWLDFFGDLTDSIDYDKTIFHLKIQGFLSATYENLEIENTRDKLIELDKTIAGLTKRIIPKKIYCFRDSINNNHIVRIGHFDLNFYFSEGLKKELEKNHLTGFDLIETAFF
jgi:hypothetical protein